MLRLPTCTKSVLILALAWAGTAHPVDYGLDDLGRRPALVSTAPLHEGAWWVLFRDKGVQDKAQLEDRLATLSLHPIAAARRARTGSTTDGYDLPVVEQYVTAVKHVGARARQVSRWLNAISVDADTQTLKAIRLLPHVAGVVPVMAGLRTRPERLTAAASSTALWTHVFPFDYGLSLQQNLTLQVPELHARGLSGRAVRIAVLDSGFKLAHDALVSLVNDSRIIAARDFVHADTSVADDSLDVPGQESHGTQVLATLGGLASGHVVGPAFGAEYILAKTEDIGSETPVEEDHYVAALEWADSLGADILTSSLSYDFGYVMDGTQGISTQAANTAASRGILLVTAMGNSGPAPLTLGAPADAFGILAVGATNTAGQIAIFSSRGPTADGRIKPEVVAQGVAVQSIDPSTLSAYLTVNGTSFATPLTSGSAALLLEAHPDWSPYMMREAMMATADRASAPDNTYGSGRFNLLRAMSYQPFGALVLQPRGLDDRYDTDDWEISLVARAHGHRLPARLRAHYEYNPGFADSADMAPVDDSLWSLTLPYLGEKSLCLTFRAEDSAGRTVRWPSAPGDRFQLLRMPDRITDDFEEGALRWVTGGTPGLWWTSAAVSATGQFALTDSPAESYPEYADAWIAMREGLQVPAVTPLRLGFATRFQLAAGDTAAVEWQRHPDSDWIPLRVFTGASDPWNRQDLDLSAGGGDLVRVRFRLTSDGGPTADGWYIDDFYLGPVPASVEREPSERPARPALDPAYPNPFNAQTMLAFELPLPADVRLVIYDVTGRRVRLLTEATLPAGRHRVRWDATDASGRPVGSGVYFCRLEAGANSATRKLVLLH